eukprot:TRINITY_DN965_c0_g1_i2.p1 TRINITY_DN965_c0_g1~~TRINITY_DN965_c0_g1_i2.p1  ORF type:complete len:110 (-),score=4.97 TRINITY_DN965_c0_g1_i2:320-649(-)
MEIRPRPRTYKFSRHPYLRNSSKQFVMSKCAVFPTKHSITNTTYRSTEIFEPPATPQNTTQYLIELHNSDPVILNFHSDTRTLFDEFDLNSFGSNFDSITLQDLNRVMP